MFPEGLVRCAVQIAVLTAVMMAGSGANGDVIYKDPTTGVGFKKRPIFSGGIGNGGIGSSSGAVIITIPGWPTTPPALPTEFLVSHTFSGESPGGRTPISLVPLGDGTFVGATSAGGENGAGTLFRLFRRRTSSWEPLLVPRVVTIHSFDGVAGGHSPIGNLISTGDGTIFGLTRSGGTNGTGTLFKWSLASGHSVLHSFGRGAWQFDSQVPPSGLSHPQCMVRALDGTIYGLAVRIIANGIIGYNRSFVLFKVVESGIEEVGEIAAPRLALTSSRPAMAMASNGTVYFACEGCLYVYRPTVGIAPIASPTNWFDFSNLISGTDDKIHGTVAVEGAYSVFTLNPTDDSLIRVPGALFDKAPPAPTNPAAGSPASAGLVTDGAGVVIVGPLNAPGRPSSLLQAQDGTFYGTWGHATGKDYVFSVIKDGGTNIIHTFDSNVGADPQALLLSSTGYLYGVLGTNRSTPTAYGATYDFAPPSPPTANQPPTTKVDRFRPVTVNGQSFLTADVLANDTDPESKPLRVFRATASNGVAVAIASPGTITIPAPQDGTSPVVTYEVTDDFGGFAIGTAILENTPPTAKPDVFLVYPRGEQILQVLANDSDEDDDTLTITGTSSPRFGEVEVAHDGKSLLYTPGPQFKGADSFRYTVSDGYGGSTTVNLRVINALADVAGSYSALIGKPNSIGSIRLNVSKSMTLTGTLQFGTYLCRLIGDLDRGSTTMRFQIGQKVLRVTVILEITENGKTRLVVDLDDGNAEISTKLTRRAANTSREIAGNYTLQLPVAADTGAKWPNGTGFAILIVGENGRARIAGRLGDGYPFSHGADFTAAGALPVYARAYNLGAWLPGGLTGELDFNTTDVSDVSGHLSWFKPGMYTGYMLRFLNGRPVQVPVGDSDATVNASGSRYTPLSFSGPAPIWTFGAMLHMEGGRIGDAIKKRFRVINEEQIEIAPTGPDQLEMKLNNRFGVLQGHFIHPFDSSTAVIEGVILQKSGRAAGVFQGPGKSTGSFTVEPRD